MSLGCPWDVPRGVGMLPKASQGFFPKVGLGSGLATTCIASAMAPWVREKTVTTITLTVDALGYAGLIYFLW